MHSYSIAGLNVASELAIPAALPGPRDPASGAEVTIRWGETPESIPDARCRTPAIEVGDEAFLFRPHDGLAFLIRDGREITIARSPDVPDGDVRLFLVGSAWGALCHQRGLLPLHCSAIELAGQAVAFTGRSGAGKSTLAAGLSKRGHAHFCDDVCVAQRSGAGVRLSPMPKGLKLWGDATDALGMARGAAIAADNRWDKYYVSVPEYRGRETLALRALYVLARDDAAAPGISRLRGGERFGEIMSNLYRHDWLCLMRDPAEVFRQVAGLAQDLTVFRFSRPWGLSGFDRGLDLLEAHMRASADAGAMTGNAP